MSIVDISRSKPQLPLVSIPAIIFLITVLYSDKMDKTHPF